MSRFCGSHSATQVPPPAWFKCRPQEPAGCFCPQPWFSNSPLAWIKQFLASCPHWPFTQFPLKSRSLFTSAWSQLFLVCSVVVANVWLWTASKMSYSPHRGHACCESSPYIQNAGHAPQAMGAWSTSRMNRPSSNHSFDSIRTLLRPCVPLSTSVASVPMKTRSKAADTMPRRSASSKVTNSTTPCVGSGPSKKDQCVKNFSPTMECVSA
mmetsp:Transcript_25405/g.60517  ORF Transcript_25405/g.60517 Transcript_25405/m.60517 type:complete len:210 (+) Transcript_25405:1236-1865(+)